MGYYLADGIYPEWAAFVKTINRPHTAKAKLYAQRQEAARKDVERAFGVLQKRWAIIRHPARLWEREELADIMYACIILHNMIVEDERGSYDIPDDNTYEQGPFSAQTAGLHHGPIYGFADVLEKHREIRDRHMANIWCRAKLKLICFLSILSITSLLVFPTLYSTRLYSGQIELFYE